MFYKKNVRKFFKFHKKTPMLESLRYRKANPTEVFSCEFCKIFRNTFFIDHLRVLKALKLTLTKSST